MPQQTETDVVAMRVDHLFCAVIVFNEIKPRFNEQRGLEDRGGTQAALRLEGLSQKFQLNSKRKLSHCEAT